MKLNKIVGFFFIIYIILFLGLFPMVVLSSFIDDYSISLDEIGRKAYIEGISLLPAALIYSIVYYYRRSL